MILAVDTSTHWTGLALHDGGVVIAEMGWRAVNTTTVELAPSTADLLAKTGVATADLRALVVAIGPGSYTGLRVGLGFAKGMALALNLPLIGVSTLDVIVAGFGETDRHLVAVAEAGRGRVCAATYRWYSRVGWQVKDAADTYTWPDLLAATRPQSVFAGEISLEARKAIRAAEGAFHVVSPSAGVRRAAYLAEIGYIRYRRGQIDDAATLAPIYLRDPGGARPTPQPDPTP